MISKSSNAVDRECEGSVPLSSEDHLKTSKPEQIYWFDKVVFYLTVSITGAAVMIIELLGTRIIGPFYGVSLIVWSSLISVTLLALAIGYYSGGGLADRSANIKLPHVILLAAVGIGLIPMLSKPVQLATDSLGLSLGALTSALLLFTLPLALLGMVGPFVIKLAVSKFEDIASTVGNVYAVSTLGSVIGTLFLGFYLLPVAGTRVILVATSLILIGLAFVLMLYQTRRFHDITPRPVFVLSCLISAVLISLVAAANSVKHYENYTLVSAAESHYGWVRVVDQPEDRIRWLLADSSTIGVEDLDSGMSMLAYQRIIAYLPRFSPLGKDALLIGLGSGHLDGSLRRHRVTTDTIEIDPSVAAAATEFFNFKPSGRLIVGDARFEIKKLQKQYDFIIHDCFTGGSEPAHLLSIEMLAEIKSHLKQRGILALNFVGFSQGENKLALTALSRTLDELFSFKRVFVSDPGQNLNDYIFFASDKPLVLSAAREDQKIAHWLRMHEVSIPRENGFVITDDYNPMQSIQQAKAEKYRKILLARLDREILVW